ncbi:DUF2786 domain-containing protein [Streptomyces pacificus]|uniref:DUF2786 domain-containing protein n=1 Tax=Streptomyces pacificus TaxID=2705029 RepID=UPI00280ACCD1|nr:DUF2786 domain-containing protein [Streptomyces pacificus]
MERALAGALYADDDDALDMGASLLAAAPPDADAELVRRGEEFVRRAWERGWQPADVMRIVRRDLGERHGESAAALIVGEARRYGDDLPPRWRAQLDGLRDGGSERPPADRFSHAAAVLELYRLLVRLPVVEPVGPIPGTAPGTAVCPSSAPAVAEPRMLTRIRALLAKAEATGYPEEAEALTAKAQELMARHSIDAAMLAARAHRVDGPGACRIGVDAPYEAAKAILLDAVASANRCRAVWDGGFGFSTVVGFESDLESVELLYASLLVQATTAMTRAEASQRAGGRKRTKTFRQSFLLAYAHRIGDRLARAASQVAQDTTGGDLLPALGARDVAVADHAESLFPNTVRTRVRGAADAAGWRDGTAAADGARVCGTDHGGELPGH